MFIYNSSFVGAGADGRTGYAAFTEE